MVVLAVRALVFAWLAWVAGGSGGKRSVLVEEFLECSQGLHQEFDEVVQFLVILGTDGINKFCGGFKYKIRRVSSERCDHVHVIRNAIPSGLSGEFASCSLGELFYNEWAKSDKSLAGLWIGFPLADGRVIIARAFYGGLEEGKATVRVGRNANLHELLLNLVIAFKFCRRVLGWVPSFVHVADEFLYVDIVQCSTVGAEVV